MRTIRRDVWLFTEGVGFVLTSAALGDSEPFLLREDGEWEEAYRKGRFLPIALEEARPIIVRVVVGDALTHEEEANWVDRWESRLVLPTCGMILSGDHHYLFGDRASEFTFHLPEVPAGQYRAEVFTYLPIENAVMALKKACPEPLGVSYRRACPGEEFPSWLRALCAKRPRLDPGHEDLWRKKKFPPDQMETVDFLVRLTPLTGKAIQGRLKRGFFTPVPAFPRLPEPWPVPIPVATLVGKPDAPPPPRIRLNHRLQVANLVEQLAPQLIEGGPLDLPVLRFPELHLLATGCHPGAFPELRLQLPNCVEFHPAWPTAEQGVRAEFHDGAWVVAFEASNYAGLRALPSVARILAQAPDGSELEVYTAHPESVRDPGHPGCHRYRGRVQGGIWRIDRAYPLVSAPTLRSALALTGECLRGEGFLLQSQEEAAAMHRFAQRHTLLADHVKSGLIRLQGLHLALGEPDPLVAEILFQKIFQGQFRGCWEISSFDEPDSEQSFVELMADLETIKECRSPLAGELVLSGKTGKFFTTPGFTTQVEAAQEWDVELKNLGFDFLGLLTCERFRELTLMGYVRPGSSIFALIGLGGLAPPVVLDFYTVFASGASQTTTTNPFAGADHPTSRIYREASPHMKPKALLRQHEQRMKKLAEKLGEPHVVVPSLQALAEAIDEFFVRWDK
ncbi:MAG: hypothetical protein U0840_30355 [Gemmataceae bacterium]